jgi:hypothetical protein
MTPTHLHLPGWGLLSTCIELSVLGQFKAYKNSNGVFSAGLIVCTNCSLFTSMLLMLSAWLFLMILFLSSILAKVSSTALTNYLKPHAKEAVETTLEPTSQAPATHLCYVDVNQTLPHIQGFLICSCVAYYDLVRNRYLNALQFMSHEYSCCEFKKNSMELQDQTLWGKYYILYTESLVATAVWWH